MADAALGARGMVKAGAGPGPADDGRDPPVRPRPGRTPRPARGPVRPDREPVPERHRPRRSARRAANAKSLVGILGLTIRPGAEVSLTADGPDADAALEALLEELGAAVERVADIHIGVIGSQPNQKEVCPVAANAPSHSMKKLINKVDDLVPESLAGLEAAHPDLVRIDAANNVVIRDGRARSRARSGSISGGGSGHEPMHGGYVGLGMLDAACAGNVFTSPVPDQMEAATRAVDGGAGVLHIVKNYTGDVLNFEMAAELVAGEIEVQSVVTNDDVAVQDSLYTAGRRGVGVTVLLEKIAGAHAEAGGSLADVAATATKVNGQGRSMGLALTSCIVPAAGTPTFEIGDDEVEVGIGIHGEPGRRREKLAPIDDMAEWLVIADRVRPRAEERRHRPRVRQRDGRHAAHRALRRVQQRQQDPRRPGHQDRPEPRRQLHHEPRDGRVLGHAAAARRRPDEALGRPGPHAGRCAGASEPMHDGVVAWLRAAADRVHGRRRR